MQDSISSIFFAFLFLLLMCLWLWRIKPESPKSTVKDEVPIVPENDTGYTWKLSSEIKFSKNPLQLIGKNSLEGAEIEFMNAAVSTYIQLIIESNLNNIGIMDKDNEIVTQLELDSPTTLTEFYSHALNTFLGILSEIRAGNKIVIINEVGDAIEEIEIPLAEEAIATADKDKIPEELKELLKHLKVTIG